MSQRGEDLTPAEQRLLALLLLLRDVERRAPALTARVMRAVRWQFLIRRFVRTGADIAAAVADGLSLILGFPRREGRRP